MSINLKKRFFKNTLKKYIKYMKNRAKTSKIIYHIC